MMRISDILKRCPIVRVIGREDREVESLVFDSRKASENTVFFAIKGTRNDGHDFIDSVIRQGCKLIVCDRLPENIYEDVTYYIVENTARTLGYAASEFYSNPSEKLRVVGVTGTNGKTTIATLLYRLFYNAGYPSGLLSTIENRINNNVIPSTHTTADQIELNRLLSEMVDAGCEYVFMEVSSHAVDQERIAGIHFTGAVFTNLTHDHLDYHHTVAAYRDAKNMFFLQPWCSEASSCHSYHLN